MSRDGEERGTFWSCKTDAYDPTLQSESQRKPCNDRFPAEMSLRLKPHELITVNQTANEDVCAARSGGAADNYRPVLRRTVR